MTLFRLVTWLFALSLAACGDASPTKPLPKNVACDVAAAFAEFVIAEAKGRPVVFSGYDEGMSREPITVGKWWTMEEGQARPATPPPAALIKRLRGKGGLNAVERCSSVRTRLDLRHVGYGENAIRAVKVPYPAQEFRAAVHTIYLPVVSADGTQAVLASDETSNVAGGTGYLQFLEKQTNGAWKVVAFSPRWVA